MSEDDLAATESEMPLPFGISAETGRPLSGVSEKTIDAHLTEEIEHPSDTTVLKHRTEQSAKAWGVIGGVDAKDLAQAGWAVLFSPDVVQEIKDALQPLLDHRKNQAKDLFKVFDGAKSYQKGETADAWLARQGEGLRLETVDPALGVPYYLLIVAPPESIPFEFQYYLDLYWAVGRLWFSKPDQFRRYADSVVRYETMSCVQTARRVNVFATKHDFDRATQLFVRQVAEPLVNGDPPTKPIGNPQGFELQAFIGRDATKETLRNILRGAGPYGPPALLFSGTHGMAFESHDRRQEAAQGAIVCQDWGGYGSINESHWFSSVDVPDDARVHGLIHFVFACYSAGYPREDNFDRLSASPRTVAAKAMLSGLPQTLLSHANGGALAVLGHIDRAWAFSFQSPRRRSQTQGFRDVIARLLLGEPIGHATDSFNLRWAALSTQLAEQQNDHLHHGIDLNRRTYANLWVARDDARNYIIFGDPAVRLRVENMPELVRAS